LRLRRSRRRAADRQVARRKAASRARAARARRAAAQRELPGAVELRVRGTLRHLRFPPRLSPRARSDARAARRRSAPRGLLRAALDVGSGGRLVSPSAREPDDAARRREAVENATHNLSVVAGAGSGKTTLLVQRLVHAVAVRRIPLPRIVAITFTEKAA